MALNFYAAAAQTGGMRALLALSFHDQTTNSIDLWNGPKSKRQKRKLNRQTRDISRNFRLRGQIELPTKVYRHLRQAILSDQIAAGTRLRETEVAAALKVSRTPVREAISRLIGDWLVRELNTGGVEVIDTMSEMEDIYHIREALELCAARLAAKRITPKQLAKLDMLVKDARTASFKGARSHQSAISCDHRGSVGFGAPARYDQRLSRIFPQSPLDKPSKHCHGETRAGRSQKDRCGASIGIGR